MAYRSQGFYQNENIQINRRVKEEVDKVMSAVHEQSRSIFDLVFPVKETAEDIDDVKEMELEPEVPLPHVDRWRSRSSVELLDEVEIAELLFNNFFVDLKMKDFSESYEETAEDIDDVTMLELEPEVALPPDDRWPSSSSDELFDDCIEV